MTIKEMKRIADQIPPSPEGMTEWIMDEVIYGSYIIYDGKKNEAVCTRCGNRWAIAPGEYSGCHGKKATCPECGETVVMLTAGRGKDKRREHHRVLSFASDGKTLWGVLNELTINFDSFGPPSIDRKTTAVYRLNSDEQVYYRLNEPYWYEPYWSTPKRVRLPAEPCSVYGWSKFDTWVYLGNLESAILNSDAKYLLTGDSLPCKADEIISFLAEALRYPSMELLYKAGFTKLAMSRIRSNKNACYWRGNSLEKIMRLPKRWIRQLREHDPSNAELLAFQKLTEEERRLAPWAVIQDMSNYYEVQNLTYRSEVERYMPMAKWCKWASTQELKSGYPHLLGDYKDYMRMAVLMGMDITKNSVKRPKNLKEAHDKLSKEYKAAEDKIRDAAIKSNARKTEFIKGGLMVVPAMTQEDLNKESAVLCHCVKTYGYKIEQGRAWIFFIRKETDPDTPYYTLEASPHDGHMVQCRGSHNCDMTDDVRDFAQKFISKLQNEIAIERRQILCQTA